tara:strand:- start:4960 stop:7605 length:2646 start_codon:yes stop_codon:yes gene_type:complete
MTQKLTKNLGLLFILFFAFLLLGMAQQTSNRWTLVGDGHIQWNVKSEDTHMDNVEMSGLQVSSIVHYGVEKGILKQRVHLIFPMLRTIPNDTHASLAHEIDFDDLRKVKINGNPVIEYPFQFEHKGLLSYRSNATNGIEVSHQLFPSKDQPVFIDRVKILNTTKKSISIDIPKIEYEYETDKKKGVSGAYKIKVTSSKKGFYQLSPNEIFEYSLIYSARLSNGIEPYISGDFEFKKREELISKTYSNLVFESPDKILNSFFTFSKLRAVESIFKTKGGLMHAPGGGRYYAAIWANDQAEYANPFFPFLGNIEGNESAINSFRHFARFINDEYEPIPSSIIAEGIDFWNGAGDRGDMAMIAYGAGRFAMAYGDKKTAKELWPLIEWCLEYTRRKINKDGVVTSDSDELEGRFPAGDANLNTSSLYYDALISAYLLGSELKKDKQLLDQYKFQASAIKKAIERYFGAEMSGYKTYKYFKENLLLRAWIATPLTVDIFERSQGTIDALFSDELWTKDGLASQAKADQLRKSILPFINIVDLQGKDRMPSGNTKEYVAKLFNHPDLKRDLYGQINFDDSNWSKVKLPGELEKLFEGLEPSDGIYWFRKNIDISNINNDYILSFEGYIDDAARIYFNGKAVGTSVWNGNPTKFIIPKSLLIEGQNSIAINLIDGGDIGGFGGKIFLDNYSEEKISLNKKWSYKFLGFIGDYRYFVEGTKKSKSLLNTKEKLNSIFSQNKVTTFWDRATLYAFRGAFAAGETERTIKHLREYSERRLLGEHVPYPVEAFPEGNQRHLSAESTLYCRAITEGLFGIRPTGLNSFSFSPKMPEGWDKMALRNIRSSGKNYDIEVKRIEDSLFIKVFSDDQIFLESLMTNGEKVDLKMIN